MLKLNLILNGLVSSLDHAVQGDTLTDPFHKNDDGTELKTFDYIVCNPPFKLDFSETREQIAAMPARFWAGVPSVPNKEKEGMAIYTCFIQHVINSLNKSGRAAIVLPSGFLTDSGAIPLAIRTRIIQEKNLYAVIQMPTNIFANTNTSVSVLFLDRSKKYENVMMVDASRRGTSIKVGDITKTVFSVDDENNIIDVILNKKDVPEFSVSVPVADIESNEYLIKPGLYFEMRYCLLDSFSISMDSEIEKMKQRKMGLIRILRSSYARNLIINWFVNFNFPQASSLKHQTDYGEFPENLELKSLSELVEETIGGEWGKEYPQGRYTHSIRCIRGTDIPNIAKSYYDDVPVRYVKNNHISEKHIIANDIIVEISGGSPIQSTGRTCFITQDIIDDLDMPVLCTNFCRILRLKKPQYAEYVYNYIVLLYNRGYLFNLENNTTGIKNLIFSSFLKKIKLPIPKDDKILDLFLQELDKYSQQIEI